jgi:probable HAF family extracellular repeat protein
MRRALFVLLLMVGMVLGGIQVVATASDQFVVLDPYDPRGINDHGDIVGGYGDAHGLHGVVLTKDAVILIDGPPCPVPSPGPQTLAYSINNRGQVVGGYNPCGNEGHGFLWADGTLTTIDVPNEFNTDLHGINDHGDIVGSYGSTGLHGFLLSKGTFTQLVAPNTEDQPVPFGINNRGDIVGDLGGDGFLLSNDRYTLFRVPESGWTEARGINDRGEIAGFWMDADGVIHAYLFSKGQFTEIHVPVGSNAGIFGLNNQDQIVGDYSDENGALHGFVMKVDQ